MTTGPIVDQWSYLDAILRKYEREDYYEGTSNVTAAPTVRDSLVPGTYEPTAATTGTVPGYTLTDYNPSSVDRQTIPDGAIINNKRIYGDLTFKGAATLRNCELVGGNDVLTTGETGILNCTNVRKGIVKLIDCRIVPRRECVGRVCVRGLQFELYRCYLSGGTSLVRIYTLNAFGFAIEAFPPPEPVRPVKPGVDVKIIACLLEDMVFAYPNTVKPQFFDGTHNHCIHTLCGRNILVKGNSLRATAHLLSGSSPWPGRPWLIEQGWANGACIRIESLTDTAIMSFASPADVDSSTAYDDNYLYGGLVQLDLQSEVMWLFYRNNHHYRTVAQGLGWSGYWIRIWVMGADEIYGLEDWNDPPIWPKSNRWVDGPYVGELLTVPRERGIQDDAES